MNCLSPKRTLRDSQKKREAAQALTGDFRERCVPRISRSEAAYFLNSFHPLCETETGRVVVKQQGVPPFVDFSIRREPDFQNPFPSITGLCRCDRLVGQAEEGDMVAYVTVKSAGPRRLVAVLRVVHKLRSHSDAADWYRREGLSIPSNCVVPGNPPIPASLAGQTLAAASYQQWEQVYQDRARDYPSFLICKAVSGPELFNPPVVPDNIFGGSFRTRAHLRD